MTVVSEAVQQAMDRIGRSMVRAIRRELQIDSELTPLPSPDHPLYELIRAQHGIARLRQRMREDRSYRPRGTGAE